MIFPVPQRRSPVVLLKQVDEIIDIPETDFCGNFGAGLFCGGKKPASLLQAQLNQIFNRWNIGVFFKFRL